MYMDSLKNIFEWSKTLPIWLRTIFYVLLAALALIASMSLSACGSTTKATIRNNADGTSTTVSITTSNPSSVTVQPDTKLNY